MAYLVDPPQLHRAAPAARVWFASAIAFVVLVQFAQYSVGFSSRPAVARAASAQAGERAAESEVADAARRGAHYGEPSDLPPVDYLKAVEAGDVEEDTHLDAVPVRLTVYVGSVLALASRALSVGSLEWTAECFSPNVARGPPLPRRST